MLAGDIGLGTPKMYSQYGQELDGRFQSGECCFRQRFLKNKNTHTQNKFANGAMLLIKISAIANALIT